MRLVAQDDRGPRRCARLLARGDERIENCGRTAGREEPARRFRIADPLPEPVDHDELELARPAGSEPGALEDVEAGREVIRDHAGPGRRRRYEREEARMIDARRDRQHVVCDTFEHFERIASLLRRRLAEQGLELGPRGAAPGSRVTKAVQPRDQPFGRRIGETAHVRGGHAERSADRCRACSSIACGASRRLRRAGIRTRKAPVSSR